MATALRRIGRIEPTNAADPSHPSLEFSVFQADGEPAAQYVIDNAHSARLLPASDGDRQVVFTHPGSIDSEAGLT